MAARTRSRFDEVEAKPKNDAYTGLLALSLIAMIASCLVLYLDYAQYGSTKAPAPTVPAPAKPNPAINQGAPVNTTFVPALPLDSAIVPVVAFEAPPASTPTVSPTAPATLPANLDGPELPKPVMPPG